VRELGRIVIERIDLRGVAKPGSTVDLVVRRAP